MSLLRKITILAAILISLVGSSSIAHAANNHGLVWGELNFLQKQGNYCDSSAQDCTGARYRSYDYNSYQPVMYTKVYLYSNYTGHVLGVGVTGRSGAFNIEFNTAETLSDVMLYWYSEDRDGRMRVFDKNGNRAKFTTSSMYVCTGGISCGSKPLGRLSWGANRMANIFDGAQRSYYDALDGSARMRAKITNVEIWKGRGGNTSNNGDCPSSCASGSDKRIWLDTNAHYMPQARVMHEIGHVASYQSNPRDGCMLSGGYDYGAGSDGAWSQESPEYFCAQFEEGLATFFASATLYGDYADEPRACLGDKHCGNSGSFNLEVEECGVSRDHMFPLNTTRYLWDVYDDQVDGNVNADTYDRSLFTIVDTLHKYASGTGNHEENELRTSLWGNSTWDFVWNLRERYSIPLDTAPIWRRNCLSH